MSGLSWFFLGLFAGVVIGYFVAALMFVASDRRDEE